MYFAYVPGAYVSAVVKEEEDLEGYVKEIPTELKDKHKFLEVDLGDFPVYILQNGRDFTFHRSEDGMRKDLEKLIERREKYSCISFKISEDWTSPLPGQDQMGSLDHEHYEKPEPWL